MALTFIRKVTKKTFLILNITIGLAFWGGAGVKYFDPQTYWFLSLLTITLPYIILLLIAFLIFWLIVRPVWSLMSIVLLAVGWNAVINIIPVRLPYTFQLKKDTNAIRIMSWNVEQFNIQHYKTNPERKAEMLKLINHYDPDIACFQEVVAGENARGINYLPAINSQLHFKDFFFAYKLSNDFDKYHHFGTIIYSKYPIIRKQFVVNNPNDYNSTFQFVDVLIGADTVRVFNVHLQSLKFSKQNREYLDSGEVHTTTVNESKSVIEKIKTGIKKRAVQADFIKDIMIHASHPEILCGDFNDVPVSYAYEVIGRDLKNAFVEKGYGLSRTFNGIAPTLRIDNIFADSNFTFLQFKRIKKDLSDHFPIVADVKFR